MHKGGNLDPQDIWNLTTPALEQCFTCSTSFNNATLGWHDFASNIAQGNYNRLTWQQCVDFTNRMHQVGTKAIVMLADNLTVADGGDAFILSPDELDNLYGNTNALPYVNQSHGSQDTAVCSNVSLQSNSWIDHRFVKEFWIDECLAIKA